MEITTDKVAEIADKLRKLPRERIEEIEDFVDFVTAKEHDRELVRGAMKLSEKTCARIWDNPDDAVYDNL